MCFLYPLVNLTKTLVLPSFYVLKAKDKRRIVKIIDNFLYLKRLLVKKRLRLIINVANILHTDPLRLMDLPLEDFLIFTDIASARLEVIKNSKQKGI